MAQKIINKGNWFLVEIIEKPEPESSDKSKGLRRVTTYGNFHLINGSTPAKAYSKALKIGKESNYTFLNSHKTKMESKFLGIGDIVPVYDHIEDGAEIFWDDYGFISNNRAEKLVRTKEELINRLKQRKE
ncbi:MAG: DUF4288 domain-containing protein [Bacteroidota bacterium]|nr:DUF4288 domain-containing protein [Bacteroidota bacterium]